MLGYIATALVGAAAMFFLDPDRGRYRRSVARDRFAGSVRQGGSDLGRAGRRVASEAYGLQQKVAHLDNDAPPENDAVLAQKVMSELFRDQDIPKGQINVNAVDGVVYLRGQVKRPDMIEHIESRVRKIDGVHDVRNMLHQPGTSAGGRSRT
jgi:osmotically-inducible protein OsmY